MDELRYGYMGSKIPSSNILHNLTVDPKLILSLAGDDRAVESYENKDVWESVDSINSDRTQQIICESDLDIMIVVSWPEIIHPSILKLVSIGFIGRHISLLPKRRGRAPVAWALIQGIKKTGVSIYWIDPGVDSGDIAAQEEIIINDNDYAADLYEKASDVTIDLLNRLFVEFKNGRFPRRKQSDSAATYTHPRRPDMGLIDWSKSANELYNFIRGQSSPYPGAFTYYKMDKIRIDRSDVINSVYQTHSTGEVIKKLSKVSYIVQTGLGHLLIKTSDESAGIDINQGDILGSSSAVTVGGN
jgi:methionyl-tRNA formyltransferase